jgi:hypothetical protein
MVSCLYGCPPFHFLISTSPPPVPVSYTSRMNLHDIGLGHTRTSGYHAFPFFIHMLSTIPLARTSDLQWHGVNYCKVLNCSAAMYFRFCDSSKSIFSLRFDGNAKYYIWNIPPYTVWNISVTNDISTEETFYNFNKAWNDVQITWFCTLQASWLSASHSGSLGSLPCDFMRDSWWMKWTPEQVSPSPAIIPPLTYIHLPTPPWDVRSYLWSLCTGCGSLSRHSAGYNVKIFTFLVDEKRQQKILSFLFHSLSFSGARGSVVGSGAMLQAGRSRVQVPMKSLDFFQLT